MLEVQLKKDLRRNILRGHPWLYNEAITELKGLNEAKLVKVLDHKKKFLAFGIYFPDSQLRLRILTLDNKIPTQENIFYRLEAAKKIRDTLIDPNLTNAYRLINGEGDLLPGLVCDVYNDVAVVQMDGEEAQNYWLKQNIQDWFAANFNYVALKGRGKDKGSIDWLKNEKDAVIEVKENNAKFLVDINLGQKTGMFLDQRENRLYLKHMAKNKRVMNLFSYTGGFSVFAGLGGAKEVVSVDISKGACEFAEKNWQINGLDASKHKALAENVFEILASSEAFDVIIADPPSMAQSEKQKASAINKYVDLFSNVAKKVKPGGDMVFSSCSSHISFADFQNIVNEALSKARCKGQVLRFTGQGPDHPYPHFLEEMRYLKFIHLIKS